MTIRRRILAGEAYETYRKAMEMEGRYKALPPWNNIMGRKRNAWQAVVDDLISKIVAG